MKKSILHFLKITKNLEKNYPSPKAIGISARRIKSQEREDQIRTSLNKEINVEPTFVHKFSLNLQTVNEFFNHGKRFKIHDSFMFGTKKFGMFNTLSRQFCVKSQKYRSDPKSDAVFKILFGQPKNKELLKDFLQVSLPEKEIEDIEYLPTIMTDSLYVSRKDSVLDILCIRKDGTKCIIEMQNGKEKDFDKRSVYYASKTYSSELNKGGGYGDLKDVIFIVITNFNLFPNNNDSYVSRYKIQDQTGNVIPYLSFVFIELPKYKDKNMDKDGVAKWCDFFINAATRATVPDSADEVIKKAYQALDMSCWSQAEIEFYENGEIKRLDTLSREKYLIEETSRVFAKKMLSKNKPLEEIMEFTGLSMKEIESLK